jgi:hypothetical protein
VCYHDGSKLTDIPISYHLPGDWRFVNSVEAYYWSAQRQRAERQANPPFDARAVLYGLPLIDFIVKSATQLREKSLTFPPEDEARQEAMARQISTIHANWLTTAREDLRARSPRDVMLEKQNLIDLDMDSRCMQWTFLGEGPPCLPTDSFAYRYAGFGTHEWVVYYDLVRLLIWTAVAARSSSTAAAASAQVALADGSSGGEPLAGAPKKIQHCIDIRTLAQIKTAWLEQPWGDYDGRTPAIILDNERRRLPITMTAAQIMIDEDCECCRMMAMDAEMGLGPTFWHLDGCNMEEEFAFSTCLTEEEWEAENQEREEFNREFNRKMHERRERIARGEITEDEYFSTESPF